MNLKQAFPSKYLKADDLQGRRLAVTIQSAEMETIQGDHGKEEKLILRFVNKEKGLVCNVTNANMIAEILGSEETDDWVNGRIVLYSTKVDFSGRRVDAIRVAEMPGQAKAPPPPVEAGDDDVPF